MNVNIPFPGLYESLFSMGLDDAEEQFIDSLLGTNDYGPGDPDFIGRDPSDVADALLSTSDYSKAHAHIAREYAERFAAMMDEECGWHLRMKFDAMESPREYNFTTDRLFMTIPRASVRRMRKETNDADLRNVARERHTSRDGFHSFYSPNVDTWGSVDTWDANQCGTLLRAWIASLAAWDAPEENDIAMSIYEDMNGNGEFDNALDKALDMGALRARLGAKS